MRTSSDFRYDAPIGAVFGLLRCQFVRQNLALARHQRSGGFVTTRFKAKDNGHSGSFL
jgi:hypothetical protein